MMFAPSVVGATPTLRPLGVDTVRGLQPLLERGEVILIEAKPDGRLARAAILKLAEAPADAVLDVVADMESYTRFIPNLVKAEVLRTDGAVSEIAWEIEVPFVNLSGVNRVVDDRPRSIRYRPIRGRLREAMFRWEAIPLSAGRSVVAHYLAADVGDASWFLREFIEARPSVEPGAVVSTGLVLMKSVCAEAARRRGVSVPGRPSMRGGFRPKIESVARELRAPGVERSVMKLLGRGVVGLVRSSRSGRLRQTVTLLRVDRPPAVVYEVARDPLRYPEFIPSVASVSITRQDGAKTRYLSEISMPLIDLSVLTELRELGGMRLALEILDGDVKHGRYAYEFLPVDGGRRTLMTFHANTDIREQSWFLRKLVDSEPYYEHGLNLGLGFVNATAVARRAEAQRAPP